MPMDTATAPLLVRGNQKFLHQYKPYVNQDWKGYYFSYDFMKKIHTEVVAQETPDINYYELLFYNEIKRVDTFIGSLIRQMQKTLNNSKIFIDKGIESEDSKASTELSLRFLYEKTVDCETFIKLNNFAICKIAKKLEKIITNINKKKLPSPYNSPKFKKIVEPTDSCHNSISSLSSSLSGYSTSPIGVTLGKLTGNKIINNNDDDDYDDECDESNPLFKKHNSSNNIDKDFISWTKLSSHDIFTNNILKRLDQVPVIRAEIVEIYTNLFRKSYPSLAQGELEYPKQKNGGYQSRNTIMGLKYGIILTCFVWIISDGTFVNDQHHFLWNNPALYVYTAIGNLLLYRFTWAANIHYWAKYEINYISLLKLSTKFVGDVKFVVDETSTILLILVINMLVFFRAHIEGSAVYYSFLNYGCPFILIVTLMGYFLISYCTSKKIVSRGLLSWKVFKRCLQSPFVKVQFRDNYAADVLTSFTKVISDILYASCWIISGSFLYSDDDGNNDDLFNYKSFGGNGLSCSGLEMNTLVGIAVIFPLWIRSWQCLRNFYDSDYLVYAHIYNFIKYFLSVLVVIVGLFEDDNTWGFDDFCYYLLIVVSSFYKWYWDVVMDWGLFENNDITKHRCCGASSKHRSSGSLFLRPILMYPSQKSYYVAIFLDLIGRFLWTVSLVPNSYNLFLTGPTLSVFLGSIEIMRRSMWGHFRVEWEHLKYMTKDVPGFYDANLSVDKYSVHNLADLRNAKKEVDDLNGINNSDVENNINNNDEDNMYPTIDTTIEDDLYDSTLKIDFGRELGNRMNNLLGTKNLLRQSLSWSNLSALDKTKEIEEGEKHVNNNNSDIRSRSISTNNVSNVEGFKFVKKTRSRASSGPTNPLVVSPTSERTSKFDLLSPINSINSNSSFLTEKLLDEKKHNK
jgi:hypothetical protein